MLEPDRKETVTGQAEILQIFELGKKSRVAGCLVKVAELRPRQTSVEEQPKTTKEILKKRIAKSVDRLLAPQVVPPSPFHRRRRRSP